MYDKDTKELKLNDQIWIDYKANNEVSSVEALKRIKLFEYSNLYLCLFFHYIIQGSLCSQRDHEKVMVTDSGVQNYTFGLGPVGLRTRLVASKYAFACYHVTQRNRRGGGGLRWYGGVSPFPMSWVTLLKN